MKYFFTYIIVSVLCFGFILMYLEGKFFCKHNWKILSKEITESKLEQYQRLVKGKIKLYEECTDKYIIQIVTCEKCGKIKKYKDKF